MQVTIGFKLYKFPVLFLGFFDLFDIFGFFVLF